MSSVSNNNFFRQSSISVSLPDGGIKNETLPPGQNTNPAPRPKVINHLLQASLYTPNTYIKNQNGGVYLLASNGSGHLVEPKLKNETFQFVKSDISKLFKEFNRVTNKGPNAPLSVTKEDIKKIIDYPENYTSFGVYVKGNRFSEFYYQWKAIYANFDKFAGKDGVLKASELKWHADKLVTLENGQKRHVLSLDVATNIFAPVE